MSEKLGICDRFKGEIPHVKGVKHRCENWREPVASPQATRPQIHGSLCAALRTEPIGGKDCNCTHSHIGAAQPAAGTTPRVDQIVLERVADGSELAMSNGKGYWAFSCFVGESREGVGSADELQMAMSMAQEMLEIIESGAVSKGFKTGKVTP